MLVLVTIVIPVHVNVGENCQHAFLYKYELLFQKTLASPERHIKIGLISKINLIVTAGWIPVKFDLTGIILIGLWVMLPYF